MSGNNLKVLGKIDIKIKGRGRGITHVFKSPSLRNIDLTPPYFHSGKVWSLKEAVQVMGTAQLGDTLTMDETDKIVGFLKATTGVQAKVEHPVLPAPTDSTPKPRLD